MESASLPALVETLILGCVLSKANSWVEALRSRFKPALSATPNLALTSILDSQFATLCVPSSFHLRLPVFVPPSASCLRSTFDFPFRSALGFPTLGLPRCYAERCLTLYVRNHAPPPYAGSRAGLARAFNYPANALSVIYIHSESIQTSNIRAQLNQALPNIRPQKA